MVRKRTQKLKLAKEKLLNLLFVNSVFLHSTFFISKLQKMIRVTGGGKVGTSIFSSFPEFCKCCNFFLTGLPLFLFCLKNLFCFFKEICRIFLINLQFYIFNFFF